MYDIVVHLMAAITRVGVEGVASGDRTLLAGFPLLMLAEDLLFRFSKIDKTWIEAVLVAFHACLAVEYVRTSMMVRARRF